MKAPELGLAHGLGGCTKTRRPRWTPSDDAKALLETIFSADAFPTFAVRSKLAVQLGIDCRQVQIWFQNRRQRERVKTIAPKSAEEDEDARWTDVPLHVQLPGGKQLRVSHPKDKYELNTWTSPKAQGMGLSLLAAGAPIDVSDENRSDKPILPSLMPSMSVGDAERTDRLLPACLPQAELLSSAVDAPTSETCSLSSRPASPQPRRSPLAVADASAAASAACAAAWVVARGAPSTDIIGNVLSAASSARAAGVAVGLEGPQANVSPPPALVNILENLPKDASGATAPHCAAPSLVRMLEIPGGARALQSAARNVLVSHPLFQHPSTPCHELLTQLASILPHNAADPPAAPTGARKFSPLPAAGLTKAPLSAAARMLPAGSPSRLSGTSSGLRAISSEALEVLSSQFFSGGDARASWDAGRS
eukprot:CAMPEP_0119379054 /NCGR_PEP_ID=MMETSP1334-20130426/51126_1 /TAXON_ID=127549 /ORGANISM="Calcidiscus leptoporus, Strain RCC1130" /LENGTH=421 /DNA_ID=CAMNT_0007398451 /DNA_START=106 /DNA_END=1371 /DNA_ORIENTATION=+